MLSNTVILKIEILDTLGHNFFGFDLYVGGPTYTRIYTLVLFEQFLPLLKQATFFCGAAKKVQKVQKSTKKYKKRTNELVTLKQSLKINV